MKMTAEQYEQKTGRAPDQDDLQRANCDRVGKVGHENCGWCEECDGPRFECVHPIVDIKRRKQQELIADIIYSSSLVMGGDVYTWNYCMSLADHVLAQLDLQASLGWEKKVVDMVNQQVQAGYVSASGYLSREATITIERIKYIRKELVLLFPENHPVRTDITHRLVEIR